MNTQTQSIPLVALTFCVFCLQAASAQQAPQYVEVARGPHHKIMQSLQAETNASGRVYYRTNRYTLLGTAMHYFEDGQWKESKDLIEIVNGQALARQGQTKVAFAANLNSIGAVHLTSPDGKNFRSHVLGLAYRQYATGESVLIAEVKDCLGAVLPPNQVYYEDAFDGDGIIADVRYTYSSSSCEQDIILLSQPPAPEAFGLDSAFTRLEVWTEFVEIPQGVATPEILKSEPDPLRQLMVEPDLIDERLDFGVLKIGPGLAFPLGGDDIFEEGNVPTGKSLEETVDGRIFLIEKVDYADIAPHVQNLPQVGRIDPFGQSRLNRALAGLPKERPFPKQPNGLQGQWKQGQLAKLDPGRKGYVIDYVTINGSQTNYLFESDQTYFLTNTVQLYGTTVLEGGSTIKMYGGATQFVLNGPVDCRTSQFNPVTFTARDDDSVGAVISGSTGSPSGNGYALYAFYCKDTSGPYLLHDLRFRYFNYAVAIAGADVRLSHCQIGPVNRAVGGAAAMRNVLVHDADYVFWQSANGKSVEHATFHRIHKLANNTNAPVCLTNSLLIAVTNNYAYSGQNVGISASDDGIFSTVGAGARYLAESSAYRDSGTTNIDPGLLLALKSRTTYPPVVLTNDITAQTVLGPQAQRDTGIPDLGYLYDPMDFVVSGVSLTNATLLLTNGVVLGSYGSSSSFGLRVKAGGRLLSEGAADRLNWMVRYNTVQEQANANWASSTVAPAVSINSMGSPVQALDARFTGWSMLGGYHLHCDPGASSITTPFGFTHCQFYGGKWYGNRLAVGLTNCLWHRVELVLEQPSGSSARYAYNNLFYGGSVEVETGSGSAYFFDNLFDKTTLTESGSAPTHGYNGYVTNFSRFSPDQTNDVILTLSDLDYQAGALGNFYYPTNGSAGGLTNLFDKGSRNSTNAGLYHFTVRTDQLKETNSVVDIGWHMVAVDANGQPTDLDEDGLPDYWEDRVGDGAVDSSETDWDNPDTDDDGVSDYLEWLQGRDALTDGAASGSIALILYTPLQ